MIKVGTENDRVEPIEEIVNELLFSKNSPFSSNVIKSGTKGKIHKREKPRRLLTRQPITLGGRRSNQRRKSRLSVQDEIRFAGVGVHMSIFGEKRARCEWCQAVRRATKGTSLESRPFSKCQIWLFPDVYS